MPEPDTLEVAREVVANLERRVEALLQQVADRQRLFDLVRYCRHTLFDAGLISQEEFTDILVGGSSSAPDQGSVRRLESYDEHASRIADLEAALRFVKKWFVELEEGAPAHDPWRQLSAPIHERIDAALACQRRPRS